MRGTTIARAATALACVALLVSCGGDRAASPTASPTAPSPGTVTLTGVITNENGARMSGVVFITDGPGSGRVASASATGDYTFTGLGPGLATLRAAANGYRDQTSQVFLNGANNLNFTLQPLPKGLLTGTVSDADTGAAIAGAQVLVVFDLTTDARLDFNRTAITDAAGLYRFENITLGNMNLLVTAPGYQEQRTGLNVAVTPTRNFSLRRNAMPQTVTGVSGWTDPLTCVHAVGTAEYACAEHTFVTRRAGGVDGVLTWQGGAETSLRLLLINKAQPPFFAREARGTAGGGRRLTFSFGTVGPAEYAIKIVNIDSFRLPGDPTPRTAPIPYTLVFTVGD